MATSPASRPRPWVFERCWETWDRRDDIGGEEEKGGRKSVLGRNVDRFGRCIAGSGD
jgi:hypothetical protein